MDIEQLLIIVGIVIIIALLGWQMYTKGYFDRFLKKSPAQEIAKEQTNDLNKQAEEAKTEVLVAGEEAKAAVQADAEIKKEEIEHQTTAAVTEITNNHEVDIEKINAEEAANTASFRKYRRW